MKKWLILSALCGVVATNVSAEGVSIHYYDGGAQAGGRTPFYVNGSTKRLNTADCNDVDDWYLDGFRVGKTHSAYQQSLLQQRVSYCQQYGSVSNGVKSAWMQGYKKGAPPVKKKPSKKKRKKQARV